MSDDHAQDHVRAHQRPHDDKATQEADHAHAEETRARLEKFLFGKDYYFNPDPDTTDSILKAMAKRYSKFGKDYCPCRRVTGDAEKDEQIICPCIFHPAEIEKDGHCHCMLFTSV